MSTVTGWLRENNGDDVDPIAGNIYAPLNKNGLPHIAPFGEEPSAASSEVSSILPLDREYINFEYLYKHYSLNNPLIKNRYNLATLMRYRIGKNIVEQLIANNIVDEDLKYHPKLHIPLLYLRSVVAKYSENDSNGLLPERAKQLFYIEKVISWLKQEASNIN